MNILVNKSTVGYKLDGATFIENSNETEFQVISPALEVEQSQFPISGRKNTEVTFTTVLKNTNEKLPAIKINLINNIEIQGYIYVDSSVTIDGNKTTDNPIDGIMIPIINQGESKVVEFKGIVR